MLVPCQDKNHTSFISVCTSSSGLYSFPCSQQNLDKTQEASVQSRNNN